jgi:hypothetical protein
MTYTYYCIKRSSGVHASERASYHSRMDSLERFWSQVHPKVAAAAKWAAALNIGVIVVYAAGDVTLHQLLAFIVTIDAPVVRAWWKRSSPKP